MSKILTISFGIFLILASFVGYDWALPEREGEAKKAQWSTAQVSDALFPGTADSMTVSFRAKNNLNNVTVWVSPSLTDSVSTTPNIFPTVEANKDYSLLIQFKAPSSFTKRTLAGTIQLRERDRSGEAFSSPLPVSVDVSWNTVPVVSDSINFSVNLPLRWTLNEQSGVTGIYPPGATNDPSGEYSGDFIIFVDQNPANLSLQDYYNGIVAPDLYGDSSSFTAIQVNGQLAVRFNLAAGIDATEVTVIAIRGAFVRFENRGDQILGDQISQSISFH